MRDYKSAAEATSLLSSVASLAMGCPYWEKLLRPRSDRPGPVNNIFIFFLLRFSLGKFYFSLQPMCVEVGRVRVDETHDRLQTKIKHYTQMIFSLYFIYHN